MFDVNSPWFYVVTFVGFCVAFWLFISWHQRMPAPAVRQGSGGGKQSRPDTSEHKPAPGAGKHEESSTPPARATAITARPILERKNTAVAAISGAGKTFTMNAVAVHDRTRVERAAPGGPAIPVQTVFLSTHFTYYHPEDQQIDLRPLRDHIEAYFILDAIDRVLTVCGKLIDERMELYRSGRDVGHIIALYIGEHGQLKDRLGESYVQRIADIGDRGRKTRIFIGYIELHSALVAETGGSGAFREKFQTRLVADSVDDRTWKVFTGDQPRVKTPRGFWMSDEGMVAVVEPTSAMITRIAAQHPPTWPRLIDLAAPVSRGETMAKPFHRGETHVSPIATLQNTPDDVFQNVDFTTLARLIKAGLVGETKGLEAACEVHAGKGERYQLARTKLKEALESLDRAEE